MAALSSDSESETVPRKKFQSSTEFFKKPRNKAPRAFLNRPRTRPIKQEFNPNPKPVVKQEAETDPVRKDIADQMQPNTRGFYAILVPRMYLKNAEVM